MSTTTLDTKDLEARVQQMDAPPEPGGVLALDPIELNLAEASYSSHSRCS